MHKANYITSPNMNELTHGFFTKSGGVSKGIYESLNCGISSKDVKKNIITNRKIVSYSLGFNHNDLLIANQTHSNKVKIVNKIEDNINCDAMIYLSNKITLGVLTADCCPILVAHKKKYIIGVIHLGWKGLYKGIIENFLNKVKSLKIQASDLLLALGPCIGPKSFEVDVVFKNKFIKNNNKAQSFFFTVDNKIFFDIRAYAKHILIKLGCTNIWVSKHDTYEQNNVFFSYRYSKHNNFLDYGRLLSVIKN